MVIVYRRQRFVTDNPVWFGISKVVKNGSVIRSREKIIPVINSQKISIDFNSYLIQNYST